MAEQKRTSRCVLKEDLDNTDVLPLQIEKQMGGGSTSGVQAAAEPSRRLFGTAAALPPRLRLLNAVLRRWRTVGSLTIRRRVSSSPRRSGADGSGCPNTDGGHVTRDTWRRRSPRSCSPHLGLAAGLRSVVSPDATQAGSENSCFALDSVTQCG